MDKPVWRFLDTGYKTAAENMALDDTLLECRARGESPDTVRLLRFRPPAVLVGYHQDVEHEVRLEFVREHGIDVNRRITGGGAIYFDETSIGWEIIASKDSLPPYRGMDELFEIMCRGIIRALRLLGINASFRPKNDVEVGGRKISGTGGTERGNAILYQGTLLVDFDVETMVKALRIPAVKLKDKELKSVKERVTCIKWELGYVPSYETIKEAIKKGFEEAYGIRLVEDGLTPCEEKVFREKLPYFQSTEWIYLDRRSSSPALLTAITKKPGGGVIRVALALDTEYNVIKSLVITGDFFVSPQRAIVDLESRLKFTPASEDSIRRIVRDFFSENRVDMPGIEPDDIADLIIEAVRKAQYARLLGLSMDDANSIYPVTKNADLVLKGYCDYVLLPYCSKYVGCEYRRSEECIKCGLCCIGDAYELAEKAGLKPITITSFEHLMDTLKRIKETGGKGFIGCCCEAFYQKHRDELDEMGVPGIIINIEDKTCYELGKQEEAYQGDFEVQTRLKLGVLSKIIEHVARSKQRGIFSAGDKRV